MTGKFLGNIGLSVVILGLVAFGVTKINASATAGTEILLPDVTVSDSATQLGTSVRLTAASVKVPKTGHMVDASFVIENSGAHDIKNIAILCTLFDAAGREQGRDKWVVYKTVKAGESAPFSFYQKMFISNSVARSQCLIVDMEIAPQLVASAHGSSDELSETAVDDTGHTSQH